MPDTRILIPMIVIFLITIRAALWLATKFSSTSAMPGIIGFVVAAALMYASWHGLKKGLDWWDKRKSK